MEEPIKQGAVTEEEIFERIQIDPEYASLVPKMNNAEYAGLKESIKTNGVIRPIVVNPKYVLLDGHQRLRAAKELQQSGELKQIPKFEIIKLPSRFEEIRFIQQTNLHRRNLNPFQKIELARGIIEQERKDAERRKKLGKKLLTVATIGAKVGKTTEVVAQMLKLSHSTIERALFLIDNADENVKTKLREGNVSINKAYNETKKKEIVKKAGSEHRGDPNVTKTAPIAPWREILDSDVKVHKRRFQTINSGGTIASRSSVDLIIADPPWRKKLDMWTDLASFAYRFLRPSGYLVAFVSPADLREVMKILDDGKLKFYWVCSSNFGEGEPFSKPNVTNCWRAILIYYKWLSPRKHSHIKDVIPITGNIQGEDSYRIPGIASVYSYLVEKMSRKECLVLDPVCGSGDILFEAAKLGRKAIGVDPSEAKCKRGERKLSKMRRLAEDAKASEAKASLKWSLTDS